MTTDDQAGFELCEGLMPVHVGDYEAVGPAAPPVTDRLTSDTRRRAPIRRGANVRASEVPNRRQLDMFGELVLRDNHHEAAASCSISTHNQGPKSSEPFLATETAPTAEPLPLAEETPIRRATSNCDRRSTPPCKGTVTATSKPENFAEAIAMIESSNIFTECQLRKLRSHANMAAKAVLNGAAASDLVRLPCDPLKLRPMLIAFHPARLRIKDRQWTDILSGLRRILRATGWIRPRLRNRPRSAAWEIVLAHIKTPCQLDSLRRLANFCTEVGVKPGNVDHATFTAYAKHLEQDFLTLRHRSVVDSVRQAWRRTYRAHPGLGITPLESKPRYNRVTLRIGELPASFHKSVETYLERCATPDPFDLDMGRALAPETIRKRRSAIHLGAQYLLDLGWPADRLADLRAICSLDAIKSILGEQFRRHSRDAKTWPAGAKPMASQFMSLATQVGQLSDAELADIRRLTKKVTYRKRGFPEKTRERLAAFDDERVLRDFFALPGRLWKEANELEKASKRRRARVKAKYAVLLAILLVKPLRIGEAASLDFLTDFKRDQRSRLIGMLIPGDRTKTGLPIEAAISPVLGRRIDEYIERFVKPLGKSDCHFLFPGDIKERVSPNNLASGLKTEIWRHLGIQFNSHLARAVIATIILDADPDAVAIAQRMLEHVNVETTIRHYGMQRGRSAQRKYQDFLSRALRATVP